MRHVTTGRLRPILVGASGLWIVALLLITGAPAVQADVSGLAISTPYPKVQVDPGGQVDLPILVESPTPEQVDLSVANAPTGFTTSFRGGGFIVSSVTTSGNGASPAPSDLKLRVEVADGTAPQDYPMTVHASSNGATADLPIVLTVSSVEGQGVSLTTAVQAKTGAIGSATTFSLTLHNDTAADLKFSVTVPDEPAGWTITATPSNQADPNNFTVAAADTDTITVSANPPTSVDAGNYQFTVVASSGDQNTATLPLGITLSGSEDISMTATSGVLNVTASAGAATSYSITLTNTGTAPLSAVSLTDSPPTGWTVAYSETTVASLAPGATTDVPLTITPPSDAVDGDYIVTLRTSSGAASSSVDVRTTVNTSSIWGYLGIGLIVLVVIGLLLVFRQYGRR